MTAQNTAKALCRLLGAWIHQTAPEPEETPDFGALFETAKRHLLTAALCAALEQTGVMALCPPETAQRLRQAKAQSVRKTILMDAEQRELLAFFERSGVWYAPLKGNVLGALYPQYGVRQFSDGDILFDEAHTQAVRAYMKARGYAEDRGRATVHYGYEKPPVYRFELHPRLFADEGSGAFAAACAAYYAPPRARLIKDEGNRFGYRFTDEDFYIYFLAHAFRHYGEGGTGLRTLLDIYLYRLRKTALNEAYIAGELQKLGLTAFERGCLSLSGKLFGPTPMEALTEDETAMLRWVTDSGVYGTIPHVIQSGLRRMQPGGGAVRAGTRVRYLLRWVFPSMAWYRENAPFAYRHRWALPFFWASKLICGVVFRWRSNLVRLREIVTPRDGGGRLRAAARKIKRVLLRPFRKPVSKWTLEKRVALAMQGYEQREGHAFDLEHPVLFTEKRLWYALFFEHPDLTRLYDKYLFKGYVEEKLGPGYTAPLYGMWTDMRSFRRDWDSLPEAFCLKSNCSSLGRNLRIIRDRKNVDVKALFREVEEWLDPMNTGINSSFRAYAGITPRIIAEKLLTGRGDQLYDYKVMCFGGKPDHFLATADRFPLEREALSYTFYDLSWKKLPVATPGYRNADIPKPQGLETMIRLAEKAAQGFPFVRVDFYDTADGVVIGEMTLYPSPNYNSRDWDLELGRKFILPNEAQAEGRADAGEG